MTAPRKCPKPLPPLIRFGLLGLSAAVLVAGLSYPLGGPRIRLWPFDRSWFMFSYSTRTAGQIRVVGKRAPGTRDPASESAGLSAIEIDYKKYFSMPVGVTSSRIYELGRSPANMRTLATYLCSKEPEVVSVSIYEDYWEIAPGKRYSRETAPANTIKTWKWIEDFKCARG